MATTKKKRRAEIPRVQHPQQRAAAERRFPRWALWTAATGPWVLAIAIVAIVAYPDKGRDSTSPGSVAAVASLPDTPDYHSLLVAPGDPRHIWLGTHVGLHESTDGGRTWTESADRTL